MPFYTNVLVTWIPNKVYHVDSKITLIPSVRSSYKEAGSTMESNSIWFYTTSAKISEHIVLLNRWVIFNAFILNDINSVYRHSKGAFKDHFSINGYNKLICTENNKQSHVIDFDYIGNCMFFSINIGAMISYKALYLETTDIYINHFLTYLDPLSDSTRLALPSHTLNGEHIINDYINIKPLYDRSYLSITKLVTLLEIIIGHSSNCEGKFKCNICAKEITHRNESEKKWRNNFLKSAINNTYVYNQYSKILYFAFTLRHKTLHAGILPTAKSIIHEIGISTFDIDRSILEHESDSTALLSILMLVKDVTRNLFLYKFYNLTVFIPLRKLNSIAFKSEYK